jgi:DNA-binding NarL/FixJ family response regulator
VSAIRQVASGKKYVSAAVAEELANAILEDDDERPLHEKLSDREYQTLVMISSGKTPTQIADELNLSVKTVSVYRARLLEKMKMKNNAELTHYGLKHGLTE